MSNEKIAQSIASMVTEWVEGGIRGGTDWRNGLPSIIEKRLARLNDLEAECDETMTVKHTPGPWTFKTARNGDNGISASGTGVFAEAFADIHHQGEDNFAEALANARLIVAAPDLLEIAFQYRSDLRHPPAPDSVERRLKAIDAAISKATS
jgi:hypothetical protein